MLWKQKKMHLSENTENYLKSSLRCMLGLHKNQENLLPLPPDYIINLFLRKEEWESSKKDQWGNWEHPYSDNYKRGKLWLPELDLWLQRVKKDLVKRNVKLLPQWPENAPFAVCLTHDVDILSDTLCPKQWIRKLNQIWRSEEQICLITKFRRTLGLIRNKVSLRPAIDNTIGSLLSIESEMGVSSTYFFFAAPLHRISKHDCVYSLEDKVKWDGEAYTLKEVVRRIQKGGSEVGLHGSYYTATVPGLLEKQKNQLEKASNTTITSIRQHFLHWDFCTTPKFQVRAGMHVDGTLGYNRNIGFRAGTCYPYYLFDREYDTDLPLLEVPLIVQDGALLGNSALELGFEEAFAVTKQLTDVVRDVGGCMSLLLHPDIMLLEGIPGYYRKVIEYCIEHHAWFTTLSEISEWWKQRAEMLECDHESYYH